MENPYKAPETYEMDTVIIPSLDKTWLSCPLRAIAIKTDSNCTIYRLYIFSKLRKKWVGTCKTFLKCHY